MTSVFRSIDYGSGTVTHIEEELILEYTPEQQISILREDLLQVQYMQGAYTLDVGWYRSTRTDADFAVIVVKNYDWENILYEKRTRSIKVLIDIIKNAVDFIEKRLANGI